MAKLTAPLLSFDARGKLGDTLVFMGWKGIKTVRQFVVPANPQSAAQTAQRGLLANAVARWKTFVTATKNAWNSWSAYEPKPMSGFNACSKSMIAQQREDPARGFEEDAELTPGDGSIDVAFGLILPLDGSLIATGTGYKVKYGVEPRDLSGASVLTYNGSTEKWEDTIAALDNGTQYYVRVFDNDTSLFVGGIYTATPSA